MSTFVYIVMPKHIDPLGYVISFAGQSLPANFYIQD